MRKIIFKEKEATIESKDVYGGLPIGVEFIRERYTVVQLPDRDNVTNNSHFGLVDKSNRVRKSFSTFELMLAYLESKNAKAYVFNTEEQASDFRFNKNE